jgi:hypothetical protein
MLEVHPRHAPVHGWRDFAVHLLTITAGLLIAIGLEAAHHHEAAQARENIEQELGRNAAHAKENIANVEKALAATDANLAVARLRRDEKTGSGRVRVEASWSDFEEAAWLTARESGALAHMPLDEVQRYADLYAHQQVLEREANEVMHGAMLAMAPLMIEASADNASLEDWRTMMLRSADTKLQLTVLRQSVEGLGRDYAEARGEHPAAAASGSASSVTAVTAGAAAPASAAASLASAPR